MLLEKLNLLCNNGGNDAESQSNPVVSLDAAYKIPQITPVDDVDADEEDKYATKPVRIDSIDQSQTKKLLRTLKSNRQDVLNRMMWDQNE